MMRQWSDGLHDDATREFELKREREHADRLGTEIVNLRMQNEFLELQMVAPWRIEDYTPRSEPKFMKRAV